MLIKAESKTAEPTDGAVAFLRRAHLPDCYFSLNPESQRQARKSVLTSWFDKSRVYVFCTNRANYIAAHFLWSEWYLKRDPWSADIYHWEDPLHKYEMLEVAFSDPLQPTRVARVGISAPRGSMKTTLFAYESISMAAICRPNSTIILSEANKELTVDKLGKTKLLIEQNERIHRDFGGPGILFPGGKYTGDKWGEGYLSFMRYNKSEVYGVSTMSKHRGRHPDYGIIDDPDDGENSKNPDWRKKFFTWMHRVYVPMFKRGGNIVWIQTVTQGRSLINYARQKMRDVEDLKGHEIEVTVERDPRFEGWKTKNFPLVVKDPETGERHSVWPEYINVEAYEDMLRTGRAETLAEYQGLGVAEGGFAFERDPKKHGFMWCTAGDGEPDYFLDLNTGKKWPWFDWVKSLFVFGGGDFAESLDPSSDYAAACIMGVDDNGIFYVLDVYNRLCRSEELIEVVLGEMAQTWDIDLIGWEKGAMQGFIVRAADHYRDELAAMGKVAPQHRGIENNRQKKAKRIIGAINPLLINYRIRFMYTRPFEDKHGVMHTPRKHPRHHDLADFMDQVDSFTELGAMGRDDAIDSARLALHVGWQRIGEPVEKIEKDKPDVFEYWREAGIELDPTAVPIHLHPPEMIAERFARNFGLADQEMDPYDM